ncbi:hypothetical protein A2U01_0089040, partial [Trifolium medium]|nr:hypothetical protein [Trifolium medium]
MSSTSTSADGE